MKSSYLVRNKFSFTSLLTIVVFSCLSFKKTNSEALDYRNNLFEKSDSAAFKPNSAEGWDTLQTYLNQVADSVEFEVLLTRVVQAGTDWKQPGFFGTVSLVFIPGSETSFEFKEPTRTWSITVYTNGNCSMKLESGQAPDNNPCIIPFKSKYRK